MLNRLIVLAILLVIPAASALAQTSDDRGAIVAVIQQQLDAFQRDAMGEAFSYASPAIQDQFRTPQNFMDMVRRGYQPVYRPQSYAFKGLDTSGRHPVQDVYMIGPDGEPVIARYTMQQQPDGSWRIHGCTLTEPEDLSV